MLHNLINTGINSGS